MIAFRDQIAAPFVPVPGKDWEPNAQIVIDEVVELDVIEFGLAKKWSDRAVEHAAFVPQFSISGVGPINLGGFSHG